jgi:hypothetical protein
MTAKAITPTCLRRETSITAHWLETGTTRGEVAPR